MKKSVESLKHFWRKYLRKHFLSFSWDLFSRLFSFFQKFCGSFLFRHSLVVGANVNQWEFLMGIYFRNSESLSLLRHIERKTVNTMFSAFLFNL